MLDLTYNIPNNIKKARIDIGMSSTAPNSAFWLDKYNDIFVIGVEPNPINFERVLDGKFIVNGELQVVANEQIVRVGNGDVLCNYNEKGNSFKPLEAAIDDVNGITKKDFYCTDITNTGCSSLHKPIDARLNGVKTERKIEVDVISLESILENFPFDKIPVIEFLKTDTQSNDLNVVKSCGKYLEKICFIFSEYYAHSAYEGEGTQQQCLQRFDEFMFSNGFKRYFVSGTDVGYVNTNLISHIISNNVLNDCISMKGGHNWL